MSEKFHQNNIAQSVFEKNYEQLPESKKEILNEKYNCSICIEIIKYENPYYCYVCEKKFHQSCLKNWDKRQKELRKKLSCPNCRNELPLEKWKLKRNHEENRTKDAEILNQLGKNVNVNEYTEKTNNLFKIILNKLNKIHPLIESQNNFKLNNLIEEYGFNFGNPSIDEISTVIITELELLEEYLTSNKIGNKKEEIVYKNEINLKYMTLREGQKQIFGENFVNNNMSNVSLIINGKNSKLVEKCYLKKGENNIKLCIKNKLTNLQGMFQSCKTLCNIDELKFLNTENVTDFSYLFFECTITDVTPLEHWNTSKSETFQSMFERCEQLTNINALKNWNVSKCKNFSGLFFLCRYLINIKSLENWNVYNSFKELECIKLYKF